MQRPRTPGGGITGALTVTLGGEDGDALPNAGTPLQHRSRRAFRLDREAEAALRLATLADLTRPFRVAAPVQSDTDTAHARDWRGALPVRRIPFAGLMPPEGLHPRPMEGSAMR